MVQVLDNSGGTIYTDPNKPYCSHRSHSHLISMTVLDASHNQIADVKLYRFERERERDKEKEIGCDKWRETEIKWD